VGDNRIGTDLGSTVIVGAIFSTLTQMVHGQVVG